MVVKFWVGAKLAFKKASRVIQKKKKKKKKFIFTHGEINGAFNKKKINKNIEIEIEKQRTVISNTFIVNFATGIEIITRFLSWTTGPPYSTVLTVSYPNTLQLFQKKKKIIN